ncbi:MAG: DUF4173 domain-containing protein [Lachnospiraceae bacterium]|nr:DUF4173 domain-containing protein [Lachnospiraceae bacterium]
MEKLSEDVGRETSAETEKRTEVVSNAYREPERRIYPTGKKEIVFALAVFCASLFLANMTVFGGFNFGFALAVIVCIVCSSAYLIASGRKLTVYSGILLVLSIVIAASFARSDDGFVKLVMVCFLLVGVNLGLCLLAGKNRHNPGSAGTLSDAGHTLFSLGFGEMGPAFGGLRNSLKKSGEAGQRSMAVLTGLGIAVPILLVIIPLLARADAAFEAVLNKLPDISLPEIVVTVLLGTGAACVLYARGVALQKGEKAGTAPYKHRGVAPLTVNTVLGAVGVVYIVYLLSQLVYFTGGFAGILPEGYTFAEYARRGFFEMAALCAINLSIILFSLWVVKRENSAPLSTRLFCLFLGIVTLFFVVAASAKMVMYIDSYGLTRLRLLTQVIMIYMGIVTVLVSVRLFVPKLPYMKVIIVSALLIGASVSWADVDTVVAKYNVDAYLSGKMETVDVFYLSDLGDGVVPQLARLADKAHDETIASNAKIVLENRRIARIKDFRGWNYVDFVAAEYIGETKDTEIH